MVDILVLVVIFELLVAYLYFRYAEIYFLLSLIFVALYIALKYLDQDEYTGARAWPAIRNWTWCGKTVTYYMGNANAFTQECVRDRMLFVVRDASPWCIGLFHGFGFHGGVFRHVDLVYMLPWVLFRIPLLRDLLLWSGAVATHEDWEGTVLGLLRRGKSVVVTKECSESLFEFAMRNKILVVPVRIHGESKRYASLITPRTTCGGGWLFPTCFYPRIFQNKPPPRIEIQVGTPMDGSCQTDASAFARLFDGQLPEV
jgi:hypothetical protein